MNNTMNFLLSFISQKTSRNAHEVNDISRASKTHRLMISMTLKIPITVG
jgi:hypothetical protein